MSNIEIRRKVAVALMFALLATPAHAQVIGSGVFGDAKVAAAGYNGPGDIVSGAKIWGSCARVYNLSLASTATSLCDLNAVATQNGYTAGGAVCTLRATVSGFVDLAASYCNGTTPALACGSGGSGAGGCVVSKVYDQIGGTSGWASATQSQRPALTFSAINGLPGWTCTSAAVSNLSQASGGITINAPWTMVAVGKRTANFTTRQAMMGFASAPNTFLGFESSTNTATFSAAGASFITLGSVADSSFHAVQGYGDTGASSIITVDSVDGTPSNAGSQNFSANLPRLCRYAGGNSLDGTMMEAGIWPGAFGSGNRGLMNSNIHGSNGYNF